MRSHCHKFFSAARVNQRMFQQLNVRLIQTGFWRVALFASLVFFFEPFVSAAQTDPEYIFSRWETEQGLPNNSVTAMVQDSQGYLWFGTFNGLIRFNGQEFTVTDLSNVPELPSSAIVNLHLEKSGRLWVATTRGLVVREGNAWKSLSTDWAGGFARTVSENAGVVCITSTDGRVFRAEDGKLSELPRPPGARRTYFGHVDRAGAIWVAQNQFFGRWDGQEWRPGEMAALVTNRFQGASAARDGSLITVSSNSILRFAGGKLQSVIPLDPSAIVNGLWRLDEDADGFVWLSTLDSGLFRVSPDGSLRHFTSTNGLGAEVVRFAKEDREGNVWVGTGGGGLARLRRRHVYNFGAESGLPERNVTSVCETPEGTILAGTFGKGLVRFDSGRFRPLSEFQGRSVPGLMQVMARGPQGSIWIGTYGEGMHVMRVGKLEPFFPDDPSVSDVRALFRDSKGRLWIGSNRSISLFENESLVPQTLLAGNDFGSISCFAENPVDGALWAGGERGLFSLSAAGWMPVESANGQSLRDILCLSAEPDGSLWLGGASDGILRMKGGKWARISETNSFPARMVTGMVDDNFGFRWFGSNRGIIRVAREALEAMADGKLAVLPHQVFNLGDGLGSVDCAGGYQSTVLKDRDGRLWFGTLKGVAMVDPSQLRLNTNVPPVLIERITCRDREGIFHDLPWSGQDSVVAPPGSRELGVYYTALSFSVPEKVQFAYMLKNSGDWLNATGRRSIWFHTPSPGPIQFRIKAANNDGLWNERGASVLLIVQPFFWQTLWFRVLAIGTVALAAGLSTWGSERRRYRAKVASLEQQRAIEEEQARLAAVLEATTDFVSFATPEGRIIYLNNAGRRLIGMSDTDDLSGRMIPNVHPPWAAARVLEEGLPAATKEGTWNGETALLHLDGREIPVSQVIIVHKASDGKVSFLSTVARDISEQRKAREELRESEERFRALVEFAPIGIAVTVDDRIVYLNAKCLELMGGKDPNQVIGRFAHDFAAPEIRDAMRRRRKAVLEENIPAPMIEAGLVRLDGTIVSVDSAAVPFVFSGRRAILNLLQDITERKLASERVFQSEARLRACLENTPYVAVQWYDAEGRVVFWNRASELMFGWRSSEATGLTLDRLIHTEEEAAGFVRLLRQIAQTGEAHGPIEFPFRRRDGAERFCLSTIFSIPAPDGKLWFVCMDIDVTERKLAEEAARRSEELFRAIVRDQSEMIVRWKPDGTRTFVNEAYCRTFGKPASELVGSSFFPLVAESCREGIRAKIDALTPESPITTGAHESILPDGGLCWQEWTDRGIFDDSGKLVELQSVGRDITERMHAEKALRQSEERLDLALSCITDGVWDWDLRTNHAIISPRLKEMLGFTDAELPNHFDSFVRQSHPEDLPRAQSSLATYFKTRQRQGIELRLRTKSGEYRWFSLRGQAVWDETGAPIRMVGSMTDITERKKSEQERARLELQLRQAQKMEAIGTLAGGIAHDFNNILTAIMAYADLARMDLSQPDVPAYLTNVLNGCERAKDLVGQILTFSRQQKHERKPAKLQPLVREVLKLLRSALPPTISISEEISPDAPVVLSDSSQLHQVLMNLCTNAAHAMRAKPGVLKVSLIPFEASLDFVATIPELRPGLYAKLSVQDSGIGMSPETVSRIFEPFFTTKGHGEGTGLGLAVVHGIVKEHDGAITVYSELGVGTTFSVFLPARQSPEIQAQEGVATFGPLGQGERVLIVDDESIICRAASKILECHGYKPAIETDPVRALDRFRTNPREFDLVITDLNMPGLSGTELAVHILRANPGIPILLASGYSGTWTQERLAEIGIRGLVMKPYTAAALCSQVRGAFSHRSAPGTLQEPSNAQP